MLIKYGIELEGCFNCENYRELLEYKRSVEAIKELCIRIADDDYQLEELLSLRAEEEWGELRRILKENLSTEARKHYYSLIDWDLLESGEYKLKDWDVKGDGSLRRSGIFENEDCLEFCNTKPLTREELIEGLKPFKEVGELNELVDFNESSGLHIHFSVENWKLDKLILSSAVQKMRNECFKRIEKSDLREELKESVIKQYNRNYARRTTTTQLINNKGRRYSEMNYLSFLNNKGMEWRSPNMVGVKSWAEFDKLLTIYLDCVEFLVDLISKEQTETLKLITPRMKKPTPHSRVFLHRAYNNGIFWIDKPRYSEITLNLEPQISEESSVCAT